jgi:hypothetical protein
MRITGAGNIGIGTVTPTQKLEVAGTVKATAFIGDGSQLTGLPTGGGGTWGSITGTLSSQADLQAALNAKQNTLGFTPENSANKGAVNGYASLGATGKVPTTQLATGTANSTTYLRGDGTWATPAGGSTETQTTILSKIATQADGAVLAVQQGAAEAGSTTKLAVKDSSGNNKFVVTAGGSIGIGTPVATYPVTIDSGIATAVPGGVGMVMLSGNNNKERIEIRSFGPAGSAAPVIQGKGAQWINGVPTSTTTGSILFALGGSGYDDAGNLVIGNRAMFRMLAEEVWTATSQPTYMNFMTTAPNSTAFAERMRITGAGNIGIGTVTPTQKLEVAGGVRVNSSGTKPACTDTTRGTFWFTNGGSTADDTMEVCAKVGGTPVWKPLW